MTRHDPDLGHLFFATVVGEDYVLERAGRMGLAPDTRLKKTCYLLAGVRARAPSAVEEASCGAKSNDGTWDPDGEKIRIALDDQEKRGTLGVQTRQRPVR